MDAETGHGQEDEKDFQRQPICAGVVLAPVADDGVDRQEGQDNEKKADHLIPQNMNGADYARDDVAQKLLCH